MNRRHFSLGVRRWMRPSWLWNRVVTMWSPQCVVCEETLWWRVHRFLIWMFVILDSGENADGFVSLLHLGPHWSGWYCHHDSQLFGVTGVNSGGRYTTTVIFAHVSHALEREKCVPPRCLLSWGATLWSPQCPVSEILCMPSRAICL